MNVSEYNRTVDLYSDNLYRFMLKSIGNDAQAKDLVQEAYLKLWNSRNQIPFEKSKSWLFTTGYRTMIDQIRRAKHQGDWNQVDESVYATDNHYSDLSEILEQGLDRLPAIQKQVVLLRDYEGYAYKEIGEITGLEESQVKVYIFRARKKLKDFIGSVEGVL